MKTIRIVLYVGLIQCILLTGCKKKSEEERLQALLEKTICGEYAFKGGLEGDKIEKEQGVFVFNRNYTVTYILGAHKETPFTWKTEGGFVQLWEGDEILFDDGRIQYGDIVFDQLPHIARFVRAGAPLYPQQKTREQLTLGSNGIPQLRLLLKGAQKRDISGNRAIQYNFSIENYSKFPDEMFRADTELYPNAKNTNETRTLIQIMSSEDEQIFGFSPTSSADLARFYFYVYEDLHLAGQMRYERTPPKAVYVILHDRKKNVRYKSNTIVLPARK